ncbi:MAG: 30S ribosomal protein S4 [Kiritimatiellae bacterium]|jgi:small subunit ribosomal protein S4|nr:30S ribosomal protein S4 [Kiritimatiellia bacterium]MBO7299177.1 30S ribosomal protein S4 [Kiritimatiellia bacterium]
MARYTGPKSKIARRFGEPIYGPDKVLDRRNYQPGMHGQKRRGKLTEYGQQLREKQKAKYIYGMLEKQFRIFFERARAKEGNTGALLLQMCESRLDNVVYRLGIAPTRPAARQLVSHKHIVVDGKVVNVPSFIVRPGMVVAVREKNKDMVAIVDSIKNPRVGKYDWLEWDEANMAGTFTRIPEVAEIPEKIDMQTIVELYSR